MVAAVCVAIGAWFVKKKKKNEATMRGKKKKTTTTTKKNAREEKRRKRSTMARGMRRREAVEVKCRFHSQQTTIEQKVKARREENRMKREQKEQQLKKDVENAKKAGSETGNRVPKSNDMMGGEAGKRAFRGVPRESPGVVRGTSREDWEEGLVNE